ncbi:zinc-ribbon domain-containing protein [Paeniglutamicibacter kerguelensis]|uniref:DNA-directed RNA polymerase subunit RPC12/RpoP n=1 Tax=Paeniglutamicibacter kerguelensis TaxID=254788 RepID=A0ABS4XD02_9MICC|nr:zinc-ribbon domain-containing protein [Paeniglutamicibacter kerguelensis]MBP2386339.1 DNA-directed RNA polymerase subunit RPC12/RpoP [Paeniglutamicibacter kerguelensis]
MAVLLDLVTTRQVHSNILDERRTFMQRRKWLDQCIKRLQPELSPELCDEVWLWLRPTVVWNRIETLREKPAEAFTPPIIAVFRPQTQYFPLEPMNRYMLALCTNNRDDDEWWRDRFVIPGQQGMYLCDFGHAVSGAKAKFRLRTQNGFHCPVCSGQRVVAGLNSLGDLMPRLLPEWDWDANKDVTPYTVSLGSNKKVGWRCGQGHPYSAYIANRTAHDTGCPYCASKAVLAGYNDIPTTHPQLASLWDEHANGNLKITEISAGNSAKKIRLRCPKGHRFTRTPAKLVATEGRCPVCFGRVLVPGLNDVATLRPDAAEWWHPTKNGKLTPKQVKPKSERNVWWLCPERHEFQRTVVYQCSRKKLTCPAETGHLFVKGVSDLASKELDLVVDWDWRRNGFGPDEIVPGVRAYWWKCKNGHVQQMSVVNRRRAGGCTLCDPKDRVASGTRKNSRGRQGWDKRAR